MAPMPTLDLNRVMIGWIGLTRENGPHSQMIPDNLGNKMDFGNGPRSRGGSRQGWLGIGDWRGSGNGARSRLEYLVGLPFTFLTLLALPFSSLYPRFNLVRVS
jgi:hypothetical protein